METMSEQELKQIQLKIPEDQYNRLLQYANKNAFSLATTIRIAIKNFLDRPTTK